MHRNAQAFAQERPIPLPLPLKRPALLSALQFNLPDDLYARDPAARFPRACVSVDCNNLAPYIHDRGAVRALVVRHPD